MAKRRTALIGVALAGALACGRVRDSTRAQSPAAGATGEVEDDAAAGGGWSANEAGAAGSGGTAGDTGYGFREWAQDFANAACERDQRCALEVGSRYAGLRACQESYDNEQAYYQYFGATDRFQNLEESYLLAGEDVRGACLEALASSSCTLSVEDVEACAPRLLQIPITLLNEGELCRSSPWQILKTCAAGLECLGRVLGCERCAPAHPVKPRAPIDDPCIRNAECQSGRCELATDGYRCAPLVGPRREGDFCTGAPDDCPSHTHCIGPEGSEICVRARATLGESCVGEQCQSDLQCAAQVSGGDAVCQRQALAGMPCARDVTRTEDDCLYGEWCVFDYPDSPWGQCSRSPPISAPTPCTIFGGASCPVATYQSASVELTASGVPVRCECLPLKGDGALCADDQECEGKLCSALPGADPICRSRLHPPVPCANSGN